MGFRLTALPEAMRDHGVDVVEVAGWRSRGREFPRAPIGGIDHWTVGAATGEAPSLTICTYGRSDLPGPLCQVLRGRRTNGRVRAFMIAAGIGNHAGRGRLPTSSGRIADGNDDLFGLEVEYRPYTEPIRDEDLDVDARIHAAAAQVCGYTAADVVGHWEYATPTGRKVDRKTIAGHRLRTLVNDQLHQPGIIIPKGVHVDWTSLIAAAIRHKRGDTDDGDLTAEEWGVVWFWGDVLIGKTLRNDDPWGGYQWIKANEPALQ